MSSIRHRRPKTAPRAERQRRGGRRIFGSPSRSLRLSVRFLLFIIRVASPPKRCSRKDAKPRRKFGKARAGKAVAEVDEGLLIHGAGKNLAMHAFCRYPAEFVSPFWASKSCFCGSCIFPSRRSLVGVGCQIFLDPYAGFSFCKVGLGQWLHRLRPLRRRPAASPISSTPRAPEARYVPRLPISSVPPLEPMVFGFSSRPTGAQRESAYLLRRYRYCARGS